MKRISVIPASEAAGCSREIPGFKVWVSTRCEASSKSGNLFKYVTSEMENLIISTIYIILKIKGDNGYVKHPESKRL